MAAACVRIGWRVRRDEAQLLIDRDGSVLGINRWIAQTVNPSRRGDANVTTEHSALLSQTLEISVQRELVDDNVHGIATLEPTP